MTSIDLRFISIIEIFHKKTTLYNFFTFKQRPFLLHRTQFVTRSQQKIPQRNNVKIGWKSVKKCNVMKKLTEQDVYIKHKVNLNVKDASIAQ